jgi:hypothetical protein
MFRLIFFALMKKKPEATIKNTQKTIALIIA